jgi:mannose-6-phosphate isomerase-like protein (cupin superfamily)
MAFRNKEIKNPQTGQSIRFLQTSTETAGALLEMESIYETNSVEPPPHYHPKQEEDFLVLEGELMVRVDGKVKVLKRGDHLHIARKVVHSMWNQSGRRTVVNWKVAPALETEYLLETASGLACEGKVDSSGKPSLLQVALTLNYFSSVFRLAYPPFVVQKIVFTLLSPVSYLAGYRSTYLRHLD